MELSKDIIEILNSCNQIQLSEADFSCNATLTLVYKNCAVFEFPLEDDCNPGIDNQQPLNFLLFRGSCIFRCRGNIVLNKKKGEWMAVAVSDIEILEKVQRRQHYRLSIEMEVSYRILSRNEKYRRIAQVPSRYLALMKTGHTIDISGGGMKLVVDEYTELGTQIIIAIKLPYSLTVLASVTRVEPDEQGNAFRTSVKFDRLTDNEQDRIVGFVFSKMRNEED